MYLQVLSALSTFVFMILILLMIYSGVAKAREENQRNGYSPLLQDDQSYQQPTTESPHLGAGSAPQLDANASSIVVTINTSTTIMVPANPSQPP